MRTRATKYRHPPLEQAITEACIEQWFPRGQPVMVGRGAARGLVLLVKGGNSISLQIRQITSKEDRGPKGTDERKQVRSVNSSSV